MTNTNPAERLTGLTLNDDWIVGNLIPTGRRGAGTGGFFSVSYEVTKGNRQAFLKAFDILTPIIQAVARGEMFTEVLQSQLKAFNIETELHKLCIDRKMKRVVKILDSGQVNVQALPGEQFATVPYMIMELADGGDVRRYITKSQLIDIKIKLHYLRDVASGILQLHTAKIAHQDLKPSNIMIFENVGAKVGDLGRASKQDIASDHDQLFIAGDMAYAPPEQLYNHPLETWLDRRQKCDLYQFGSLVSFIFFGKTLNMVIGERLPQELAPEPWGGTHASYTQSLPFLMEIFHETLAYWKTLLPEWLATELIDLISQCGTPSYTERGSRKALAMSVPTLGLDRFISQLDRLGMRSLIENRKFSSPEKSTELEK